MTRTMLSVSSCWASRLRVAPNATRRAISFWRVTARLSRRLAMLAQAINNTMPTAAKRVNGANASLFVVSRVKGLQISSYLIQIGLSLLQWNTRLEPGEYAQWMGPALPRLGRRSEGQ